MRQIEGKSRTVGELLTGAKYEIDTTSVPGGIPEDTVRVISENATVLKFDHAGFEKE